MGTNNCCSPPSYNLTQIHNPYGLSLLVIQFSSFKDHQANMFEVYALIAGILLPTGIFSLSYFGANGKKDNLKNAKIWSMVFESCAIVVLGIFYLYSAIILSRTQPKTQIVFDEIDDLAIVNDTNSNVPTFYQKIELQPDTTNEIEDTRQNKYRRTSGEFLENYYRLVYKSIKQTNPNNTTETRSVYGRMLESTDDILENRNCFLRTFLYQALLVYSFITSAISLFNTCQLSQNQRNPPSAKTEPLSTTASENFGEKIEQVQEDFEAPVGPLFDNDSLSSSSTPTNLDVFSVKTSKCRPAHTVKENQFRFIGVCVGFIILPIILVLILFYVMQTDEEFENDHLILPNFNETQHMNFPETLFKSTNDSRQKEITLVLENVYKIINKFQEEHKNNVPKSLRMNQNSTKIDCVGYESNLRIFDFFVILLTFFGATLYGTIQDVKSKNTNIRKCLFGFWSLWSPSVLETTITKLLTSQHPNIFSTICLLVGNFYLLYAIRQKILDFKTDSNIVSSPISK